MSKYPQKYMDFNEYAKSIDINLFYEYGDKFGCGKTISFSWVKDEYRGTIVELMKKAIEENIPLDTNEIHLPNPPEGVYV